MSEETNKTDLELLLYIKSKQDKFDYAFLVLIFASFALSIQFSPTHGFRELPILFISWIFYLLSGLIGGWRMMMAPQIDSVNRYVNLIKKSVRDRSATIQRADFQVALQTGRVADIETGHPLSEIDLITGIQHDKNLLTIGNRNLEKYNANNQNQFYATAIFYISALFFNGIFIAINLAIKSLAS